MDNINYGFLTSTATGISGEINAPIKQLVENGVLDESLISQDFTDFAMDMNKHQKRIENSNGHMVNPFTEDSDLSLPKDSELDQEMRTYTERLNKAYKDALSKEKLKEYPGLHRYLEYNGSIVDSALNGVNRYSYLSRLSGDNYSTGNPDWMLVGSKTKQPHTVKEFDDMLVGMRYPEMWDTLDKRIDLEREMEQKKPYEYSPEEKKAFSEQIKESNQKLISIYEHQMSDESKEKYSDFFRTWDEPHGSVAGGRGPRKKIARMKAENEALDRGWDPTRIADFNKIKDYCNEYKLDNETEERYADPKLNDLKGFLKKLDSLDPTKQTFSSQKEFETYSENVYRTLKDITEEIKKPEVSDAIKSVTDRAIEERDAKLAEIAKMEDYEQKKQARKENSREYAWAVDNTFNNLLKPHKMEYMDFIAERIADSNKDLVDSRDIDRFENKVDEIRTQAKEKLENFEQNLDGLRKENSQQYKDMKAALEAVANLPKDASLDEVTGATWELQKAAQNYVSKNDGFFKSRSGRARLNAAEELVEFSTTGRSSILDLTKETTVRKNSSIKTSELNGTFVSEEAEKAAGVDEDLMSQIDAAMKPEKRTTYTRALDDYEDTHQSQMEKNYDLGYDNSSQRAFKTDVAKKIVIHTLRQQRKEGQKYIDVSKIDDYAHQIASDPAFKEMMNYDNGQATTHASRKQFVDMEPGEVFAKYAMQKQHMKMQEAAQKNNDPKKQAEVQKEQQNPKLV